MAMHPYSGFAATLSLGSVEVERATVRWSEVYQALVVDFGDLTVVAHGENLPGLLRRLADEVEAARPPVAGAA